MDIVQSVHMSYRVYLEKGNIVLLGDKLLLFKTMSMDSKAISLTIVTISLRRTLFYYYHGGPSGGHIGEYKTLYRIRMRFFWLGLREEIKNRLQRVHIASVTMCGELDQVSYTSLG